MIRSIHPEADASTGNQAVMVRLPATQSAIFQASVSFEAGDPESVSRSVRCYAIRGLAGN
ncbi:hypothetical protein BJF79_15285 [Actinomadura sp. CNU-125]|uniref:hypothetical protein n=1 Tax=Actinomadura sp. CNU-125 TaxID=1904961 RepID=UPI0009591C50|nr:hypothetical protein [Actinomadura sp. CNU-125]OLT21637.1 hypothetical protein BJF79_15285 [Actinomadura sp. CNU-125]